MPRYLPNTRFSDCWSSVGNVTFYHRDGICYFKSKPQCKFPGTQNQLQNLDLHRRAIAAWRSLDSKVQAVWNDFALSVEAHRPPFHDGNHISGYNLFVSAYHGHAQLGNEHVPEPHPFVQFPMFGVSFVNSSLSDDGLKLKFKLHLYGTDDFTRYRVLFKIQVVKAGEGKNPGLMRNYLSHDIPTSEISEVSVNVKSEMPSTGDNSQMYGIHVRYLLMDTITGYRSQYRAFSTYLD